VVLDAVAEGDPRLRPGRVVTLEGFGEQVDGRLCITHASHVFDERRGYVVELQSDAPRRPKRRCGLAATLGRVTDAADPEGCSRVRAALPGYGDIETDWMPVVIAGAGVEKGVAVLPEPGDDVLILFPDGDPARGLVLGGLYGTRQSPGQPSSTSGARSFTLRTPGGQALVLDSASALARLETSAGDVFELTPNGARLSATRDLLIEAPGRRLTIRAQAVEFEQG
jgi:phage baseplate assembly protein gpV